MMMTTRTGKAGKAKELSKKDFLEMLKNSTKASSTGGGGGGSRGGGGDDAAAGGGGGGAGEPSSWAAIQDDYMMDAPKLNVRNRKKKGRGSGCRDMFLDVC